MKIFFRSLLILSLLFLACSEKTGELSQSTDDLNVLAVPETIISKSALKYDNSTSRWTLNDLPFSGFAVDYYSDSTLREKFGILNGKKHKKAMQYFPDGHLKIVSNYHNGKLHGERKTWSSRTPHVLIAQFNYHTGKAHGVQRKWYPTGELYKKLNLNRGKEEGIQQAFRKNGLLYANYEAKNGRIFGMKKANLCYQLEDEVVVRNE